ncbi:UDP-glucose dehydrogenase family protein [Salisaeta longa]|uniref:UDP-glucose dehydrogenase family protein n=1 Tax=Salisaeta longa TaxID=503170 RepID=UPI0003B3369C|nr:UDP-glucose/GDP-mannose dehydrogenase family protein [Salisaeta longa]
MHISIVGTGYVGLVSGVCLAEKGHTVTCVDIDAAKVQQINQGDPPIYEAGLAELLARTVGTRLFATTDLPAAVHASDLTLIAVGTPFDGTTIDLSYIKQAARDVGAALRTKDAYHAVIVKSTVVPGTTSDVVRPLLEEAAGKRAGRDFGVGMNPEFLREGTAIEDFMAPDRIVMGGMDERTLDRLDALYAVFPDTDKLRTTPRTAEMIKYAANALLATLISYSNEIGNLCSALGDIDAQDVMRGVHLDKRMSPLLPDGSRITPGFTSYLSAGCGFGGSCFPKDVKALVAHGSSAQVPMPLLQSVLDINAAQPQQMLRLLRAHLPDLRGRRVAVLGLAFKPGTDDVRESPALPVIRSLRAEGAHVMAYDPVAAHEAQAVLGTEGITYAPSLAAALSDAEAVLLITRWPAFAEVPALLEGRSPAPVVIDGRRMLAKDSVPRYAAIGWSSTSTTGDGTATAAPSLSHTATAPS